MAKYSNVIKEASRRYNDFKARGFIPEGYGQLAYRDFIEEVKAENKGDSYTGAFTKGAYEEVYDVDLDYYEEETFESVRDTYDDGILDKYIDKLEDILNVNDLPALVEKYNVDFAAINMLDQVADLKELVNIANYAKEKVAIFLFRKISGRNRRTESDEVESARMGFEEDLTKFINEVNAERMRFM